MSEGVITAVATVLVAVLTILLQRRRPEERERALTLQDLEVRERMVKAGLDVSDLDEALKNRLHGWSTSSSERNPARPLVGALLLTGAAIAIVAAIVGLFNESLHPASEQSPGSQYDVIKRLLDASEATALVCLILGIFGTLLEVVLGRLFRGRTAKR